MGTHGRYAMLRKIADGGMAELFLARQTGEEGFSRTVVVKRILPAYSADPHFRDMLLDEAHIAMTLNHSNVVPVLDLGRAEGSYFLVMELVDGWDLAQIYERGIKASFYLPLGLALYVVAEVCRGLGYAHARKDGNGKSLGIVHRDVSPHNILVSEHGEVKVTDFGIAKAMGRRDRTQTGMIKGKLDFMSPEQAKGAQIDAAADIFTAGTVLYLLCTGQRPFASNSDMEALARVQRADFTPPQEVRPGLSPGVVRILNKAMRAQPADRYRSAEEMMLDLENILRQEFGSPGQSQLKAWLAELSSRDGELPLSRRPALEPPGGGAGLTNRWFAEGEMLSFDDSSKIKGMTPATSFPEPAPAPAYAEPPRPFSAPAPSFAAPRQMAAAAYADPPMPVPVALHRPMMQAAPGAVSRMRQMSRRIPIPTWATRPVTSMTSTSLRSMERSFRPRHRLLKTFVVLVLLAGGGVVVASRVMPKDQQERIEADARAWIKEKRTLIEAELERRRALTAAEANPAPAPAPERAPGEKRKPKGTTTAGATKPAP
jgi:serine/threonine-protein kinase